LTMKLDTATGARSNNAQRDNSFKPAARNERTGSGGHRPHDSGGAPASAGQSAMAAAFAKLQTKR
jgi:uncharacterized protein